MDFIASLQNDERGKPYLHNKKGVKLNALVTIEAPLRPIIKQAQTTHAPKRATDMPKESLHHESYRSALRLAQGPYSRMTEGNSASVETHLNAL